jgi:hypothetical protein
LSKEKNIKDYSNYLGTFIIINLSIYLCVVLGKNIDFNNINEIYKNLAIKDGIISTSSILIVFILNGILSSNLKGILVFWRTKNILPGCRIFTELIDKDNRIDKSNIIEKYGQLPTDPELQNKLWYRMYKTNEFHPMIFDSQRNFLISRDLTGLSFLFLIIYSIAVLIIEVKFSTGLIYIGFLLMQYIIISLVGRNYGNRFSCNVLAMVCINNEQIK